MSPLSPDKFQAMLDHSYHLHSKQEAMKISEAMDNPFDQRSEKQHKILIDSLSKNNDGVLRTM